MSSERPKKGCQDRAQQEPQPVEQEAEVVADGGEHGVDGVAGAVSEVVAVMRSPKAATSPWLGPVPRQMLTGDRTILGKISKRGSLPARLVRTGGMGRADQAQELGAPWAQALARGGQKRLHHNVLPIALANKLARIAWSVLARGRSFEARTITNVAAQTA